MAERQFFQENSPEVRAQVGALAALLILAAAGMEARAVWVRRPQAPEIVVEVAGQVPRPGTYALPAPAHVRDALAAAGADPGAIPDAPVETGTRLTLRGGAVAVGPMKDPLVAGLPVNLNTASAELLTAIPGLGPSHAEAIVADRAAHGAFATVDDLDRVKGFGPATLTEVRPYLTVSGAP